MKPKKKKALKVSGISFGSLVGVGFSTWIILLMCNVEAIMPNGWEQTIAETSTSIGQLAGIMFAVGFLLGLTFLLIYPIKMLIQWNRKRKLRNANLAADLAIKEAKLQQIQDGIPQQNQISLSDLPQTVV